MTTFLDGPAAGQHLLLRRAVYYIRAERSAAGKWDALDQPTDTPSADEDVFAYRAKKGTVRACHINSRGKGGERTGGFFKGADYELVEPQPSEAQMRSNSLWAAWCKENEPADLNA